MTKPLLAVSACLLGREVRYDGQHKRDRWITERLSVVADLFAVCPEVELGLGVPRAPIQLERDGERVLLRGVASRASLTDEMLGYTASRLELLGRQPLCGYILKSKSPSCGLSGVKVLSEDGTYEATGRGLFAAQLAKRFPALPLIEEVALSSGEARLGFLTRVFSLSRLQALWASRWSAGSLLGFHHQHKLLLMAHAPERYQALNLLMRRGAPPAQLRGEYHQAFVEAFGREASAENHLKALHHALSYFHGVLSGAGRFLLQQAIQGFQEGRVALPSVLRLIADEAARCGLSPLAQQHYLEPFPWQLLA